MNSTKAVLATASVLVTTLSVNGYGGSPAKAEVSPMWNDTAAEAQAPAATPKPAASPAAKAANKVPTYTDVLKTFPRDHKVCRTVVYLVDVLQSNIMLLSVSSKGTEPFQRGPKDPTIRCCGTQIAVLKDVTLEGKKYSRGAKLTVDNKINWIEVSSWQ